MKELRLAGISDIEAGNEFLPGFMKLYNAKFAKSPARPDDLHRPLNVEPERLTDILCWRDTRCVGRQLTIMYERKKYMFEVGDLTRDLPGKYVETYAFPDGRFQVRWKGIALPYRVFDKEQRVTHAAITENKLLGDQLAMIKEMQEAMDAVPAKPKRSKTNSERGGYKIDRPQATRSTLSNSEEGRREERKDGSGRPRGGPPVMGGYGPPRGLPHTPHDISALHTRRHFYFAATKVRIM